MDFQVNPELKEVQNKPIEPPNINENFLNFSHDFSLLVSTGQGNFLEKTILINESVKIIPVIKKIAILYFDKVTRTGKDDSNPTKAAPAPIKTNKAGRAQHINVLVEKKSAMEFRNKFISKPFFVLSIITLSFYFCYIVTRV